MFYYSLDFHDLAPDAILHITPCFGLWPKTFNVKPKMIEGRHAECGGAVIRRNADAPWPEGFFPEVYDLWQRRRFYVTAPRGTKWVAAPDFRSGPHLNWHHGPMWDWIGGRLMMYQHGRAAFGSFLRGTLPLSV